MKQLATATLVTVAAGLALGALWGGTHPQTAPQPRAVDVAVACVNYGAPRCIDNPTVGRREVLDTCARLEARKTLTQPYQACLDNGFRLAGPR